MATAAAPAVHHQPSAKEIRLVIAASSAGTVFEWYDFFIYGTLAGLIGAAFFPADNETLQLLLVWAGFAVGFGFRRLGAILVGYLGDKLGRKSTFLVTVTLMGVAGLTAVAFITRKDFSFLRGILVWGGVLALIAIVSSVLFSFDMGTWFSVAMIGFAGAAVLYDTSNILHHYPEDRHVAAALELFGSIGLMFWYVLQLFMSRE